MKVLDINYIWIGSGSFLFFILVAIFLRIGAYPNPWKDANRMHLRMMGLYFVASAVYGFFHQAPWDGLSWLLGLYAYIALHYAAFLHFFAVIFRSFSLNICVTAYEHGAEVPLKVITDNFAGGKGVDYIKNERLETMRGSGAVFQKDGFFHLAPFGSRVTWLNRLVLKLWGLNYLGKTDHRGTP